MFYFTCNHGLTDWLSAVATHLSANRTCYSHSTSTVMVALCVAENEWNDHYILRRVFFQTLFLRLLCTDFLETLPHDIGPLNLVTCPVKEVMGQNINIFVVFWTTGHNFAISFRSVKKFYNYVKTIAYNIFVHSLCVPNLLGVALTITENGFQ